MKTILMKSLWLCVLVAFFSLASHKVMPMAKGSKTQRFIDWQGLNTMLQHIIVITKTCETSVNKKQTLI